MNGVKIPSPEEFFGFKMGADRKLARWDKIVEYFEKLESLSNKIKLYTLGDSTMGNPFIMAVISSRDNLERMDEIKEINAKLADPRTANEEEVENLINEGKSVVAFTMGLHASEVSAPQMSNELAYELLTEETPEIKKILEETVLLLFPSFNPDGQIMVVDYYNELLGTEYEGGRLPWLYHKYVGHDNARDGFQLTQVEGRMFVQQAFREWHAQAYVDFHQMGSSGARYYIPPYTDPINPNMDPLVWREHQLYGAQMGIRLQEEGKTGVESAVGYTGYWIPAFHLIGNFHNCASMITESASPLIATPIFIDPHQLGAGRRGRPEYKAQTTFPNPWPGGWWRLRDLVEQQKISAYATLEVAANLRGSVLRGLYVKARRNIEKGRGPPRAYIIPKTQHDYLTALKMLEILSFAGVEIHRSKTTFQCGEAIYPQGTHVIFLEQPLRGYIKTLMEQTSYPDNPWTRDRDGSPIRPYDMTTYTMAEFMGVKTIEADISLNQDFEKIDCIQYPDNTTVESSLYGYLLDPVYNDCFTAVMKLLQKGYKVSRVTQKIEVQEHKFEPGAFHVESGSRIEAELSELNKGLHLPCYPLEKDLSLKKRELKLPRIAMYQRYLGGNMDEGWTRWLLENFGIPYETIMADDIEDGKLSNYDVLILPSDSTMLLTGKGVEQFFQRWGMAMPKIPPQYSTFLGEKAEDAIRSFVKSGGTIVSLNESCDYIIDVFKLPITNVVKDAPPKDFYCPGSTLKIKVDNSTPTAYGMPSECLVVLWNSPAFSVLPNERNHEYKVVSRYPESRMLQSGWLIGEEKLSRKAAMIDAKYSDGRIILIGFRPQLRAQTHGTFKFLFNSLI